MDRYGDLALVQSFHRPLASDGEAAVAEAVAAAVPGLTLVYNDRSGPGSAVRNTLEGAAAAAAERPRVAHEGGVALRIQARHRGNDPWLFLDLREVRRAIAAEAAGRSMLNLFAYTCGAGVAAAAAGARRVLNVDFARTSLAVGRANAQANGVEDRSTFLVSDAFPALRQLAGGRQPPVARGRRLPPFPRVAPERFDLVLLDPPRLARSRFGVVDLARDYPSVLKPAMAVVADGGVLYCTNNDASVDAEDWHEMLRRSATRYGRPLRSLTALGPGPDFPSNDARPPLKAARLQL